MPTIINPTITDAGLAAAVNASTNSLQVQITHVAIGSGAYTPNGSETGLVNRLETVAVAAGAVELGNSLSVSVLFPAYAGAPYDAREIGFYLGNPATGGILFAVYSSPAATGFVYRSSLDFIAQFSLGLTSVPAGSVTVSIDPQAAVLFALIDDHRLDPNAHPAYLPNAEMVGAFMAFATETPPPGWLVANGAAISRTVYVELFNKIGTRWGAGDGSTTFNLPPAQNRTIVGAGATFAFASAGGNKDAVVVSHSHSSSFVGDHAHGINLQQLNSNSDVGFGRLATGGSGPEGSIPDIATYGAGAHGHTIDAAGVSGINANMPPYLVALMCIKYE